MNNTVILCTRFGMGHSDSATLPLTLIEKYFNILLQNNDLPAAICFYTDGVKLVTSLAPESVSQLLKSFESNGVRLIVCSTCLDAMSLKDKVVTGIVGGMPDIVEAQMKADKVITI